jgi:4-amino-4-deoxy-L-arabinose transferase-like glycosyltransferase
MRLTPPEQRSRPANFPQPSVSLFLRGGAIALAALAVFSSGLYDDSFYDEYAYITQSYYSELYFSGRVNDPAWIDDLGMDLQPLPKYFIGVGLRAVHLPLPGPRDALRWYRDAHTRFGPPLALTVARIPFIATGVLGCVALFACGVLIGGQGVGTIGALLLLINPLFRLHAHRAMADVPCEAFLLTALALALWGVQRLWSGRTPWSGLVLFGAAGLCSGISVACKLNGLLAPMITAAWCGLSLLVPWLPLRSKSGLAAGLALAIVMAAATFLVLNPTLTARPRARLSPELAARARLAPWGRFRAMIRYRLDTAAGQRQMGKFSPDVLRSPCDKSAVFAVQGFGRFGPFGPAKSDSEVRYEVRQDWGLVLWMPLVLIGLVQTYRLGLVQLRDRSAPMALALVVWAVVAWGVVAAYLPLAWDRYLLPIQAPNALLAAVAMAGLWDRWRGKAVRA